MKTGILAKKIMLLGSGELGKEFAIAAKKLGLYVIAIDRYAGAPAMSVSDEFSVIDMLDPAELTKVFDKYQPDIIVPEIEAIRTEKLIEFEALGTQVVPTARAVYMTMNRDAIRDLAANELGLKTARFCYATNDTEFANAIEQIGLPCVVKPVMSSSGKGQSVVRHARESAKAWKYAIDGMRGDKVKVIVEEFIRFDYEITLLTIKQKNGPTIFVDPIGHRQERGDYQESWMPVKMEKNLLLKAKKMAKAVTDNLCQVKKFETSMGFISREQGLSAARRAGGGKSKTFDRAADAGCGLFGVEFLIAGNDIYFSEISPRPHDTGLVTLISQDLSQFDLHLRAILGIPISRICYRGPSASAVILSDTLTEAPRYHGIEQALEVEGVELRVFGKPQAHQHRRMGVALASGASVSKARLKARAAAAKIKIS
jgi:phosphoribosylglycinamide formyltransferase 2